MSAWPVLRTARLVCRLGDPADAPALLRYRVENRAHLAPWEPLRSEDYFQLTHCRESIDEGLQAAAQDRGFPFLALDIGSGEVLASFTFSHISRGPFQAAMLGYGVAAAHQGRGVMREALEAGLEWAFSELGLHRVMANYLPRNVRSGRLLASLGFEREGLARAYLKIAGAWEDHVLTARIAPDEM